MADNKVFSYTNRDYESTRKEGLSKIPSLSGGLWTDLNATDPGVVLLDYVHALVDMVQYYQDHQALESFLSTAKERKNIFRLAHQLGYKISSAKGAKVDVTFRAPVLYSNSVLIPKHTAIKTSKGEITYLTIEDKYVAPETLEFKIPCIQGDIGYQKYTGTGIDSTRVDIEFAEDQVIILTQENIDTDTIEVVDDSQVVWTRVDNIVFAGEDEKSYEVRLNYDGTVSILFGNGLRGYSPKETDIITVRYIYSLGEEGRVGAYTLTSIEQNITDSTGSSVKYEVANLEASSGGSGPESDEDITRLAPGVIKAQGRAVTREDFENLARTVDGVHDAIAYDINNDEDMLHYQVKVVIIPDAGSEVNQSLIDSVYNFLHSKMTPPTNLEVVGASKIPIDIELDVKQNSYIESYEYDIREAIAEYFTERRGAIGEEFNPNDIIALVSNLGSVRSVDRISPASKVPIGKLSIATLGELTIKII